MAFTRPTLTAIITRIQNDVETRLDGIGKLLRRSVVKVMIRAFSGALHLLYGFQKYMALQLFAATADTEYLEIIGEEFGVTRNEATAATGNAATTGTTGKTIPAGTELQSDSGYTYTVDTAVTLTGGVGNIALTAAVKGTDSNDDGSITLTFVSPITGINSTVTVDSDGLTGGADKETDIAYRDRILTRKRRPPHGGTEDDYVTWAKEVSGVTRAWCFPQYQGNGTVGMAFVYDDRTSIVPATAEITSMTEYITEHSDPASGEIVGIPVTATPGFEVVTLVEKTVNFTITLEPNTTAVQTAVEAELEALLLAEGGPGETIYISEIDEAISYAAGETRHELSVPSADVSANYTEVHVLGTITFQSFG